MNGTAQGRWRTWWPLVLLLALRGVQANLADSRPIWNPSIPAQCFGLLLAAVVCALVRKSETSRRTQPVQVVAGAAVLLSSQTPFLLGVASPGAGATLIALTLVPAVIAVAHSSSDANDGRSLSERLWPSLAAAAGVLLLVVQPSLNDWRQDLALALMPLMAGIGAASLAPPAAFDRPAGCDFGSPAALLAAAGVLGCTWLLFARGGVTAELNPSALLVPAAIAGLLASLNLYALSAAGSERWSAQFVVLPFVLLLEGPVMLGVHLGPREWVGFALILAAALRLLIARQTVN